MKSYTKTTLTLLAVHLLFGVILFIFNYLGMLDDKGIGFLFSLIYYFGNYSGVWLLKTMGIQMDLLPLVLAGIPQWLIIAAIITVTKKIFPKSQTSK